MVNLFLLLIAFLSSTIGSICGVGGGVLMKPVLDFSGLATVSVASFLSSMTVLAMTCYSTAKNVFSQGNAIEYSVTVPLGLGAAIGGVIGKLIFQTIQTVLPDANTVGAVQAVCLGIVAIGTLLYTVKKEKIKTKHITNSVAIVLLGLFLGCMSSFLGIGGGPIDLVVLLYFFSMPTKTAVQNSLFIIMLSQSFSLLYSLFSHTVPDFEVTSLLLMIAGGIGGGAVGRSMSKKMSNQVVDKLFIGLLAIIVLISVYNFCKYI